MYLTRPFRRPSHFVVSREAGEEIMEEPERDFITDLVGKIFGKEVLEDPEPFGLKRMTKEEWPDQWPAVTNDFDVAPLEADNTAELKKVRGLLKQTQMEKLPLGLAYDASVHGWSAAAFHKQLDGQGAGLLVGVTKSGTTFGGYNPRYGAFSLPSEKKSLFRLQCDFPVLRSYPHPFS